MAKMTPSSIGFGKPLSKVNKVFFRLVTKDRISTKKHAEKEKHLDDYKCVLCQQHAEEGKGGFLAALGRWRRRCCFGIRFLLATLHLAVMCSGGGGRPVRWEPSGSGGPAGSSICVDSCLGYDLAQEPFQLMKTI